MARSRPVPPAGDFIPVATLDEAPGDETTGDENPGETTDPRDEEIAKLRAENARLRAARPGSELAGKKARVSLKDGPMAVVECAPGEHPFDAFKRVTGVLSSEHTPVIDAAGQDERCGICDHTGKVPEPRE